MNSISPQMLELLAGKATLVRKLDSEGEPRDALLTRLLGLAARKRWVLVGGVVGGALLGVLLTLVTPRQYTSTVRLQISRESAQVVNVGAISRDVSVGDQEFYLTQYGLLRARTLAERVARDVAAVDDPAFFKMFGKSREFVDHPGPAGQAERNGRAGEILLRHVVVAPVRGSSLVDITAKSPSPGLSKKIAETWGRDFIIANLERRTQSSGYATQFLQGRLDQLRDRLESSERRAMEYAAREGIIDLPSPDTNDLSRRRSLTTDDLVTLNSALGAATTERIRAATQLAAFAGQPDASSDAFGYRAIGFLRQERAEAAANYAKLAAQSTPDDPGARAARAQIDALDAAIKGEEDRLRSSLQQTYQAALAREQALTQRVDALKRDLASLRRRSIQYNIYQRDTDTNRALYDGLLQRYKEIGVAGAAENNNIAVVDAAQLPDRPSSPLLVINLLLCTLAGAVLGMIVAAFLEQIDEGAGRSVEPTLSPAARP